MTRFDKNSGFWPVASALGGNLLVTILKFAGFSLSGSSALFSEGIHSLADTSNQALLLVGIKRSSKKATRKFSYGYGHERFFWALISACGIFFLGAGVTIYKGISDLRQTAEVHISPIIFIILILSLIIESFTLIIAFRAIKIKNQSLAQSLRQGDPSSIAVLYEDGVAVLGIFIALASIILTYLTGQRHWDAAGSVFIGVLLAVVAIILIAKNREYLLEKSMPEDMQKRIIKILEAEPAIEKVIDFKSSTLDFRKYRIKCEIEFNGPALMQEAYRNGVLREEYARVKNDYEAFLRFCVDYIDRVPRLIGSKIDAIEKKIQKKFPEVIHVDIEIN
ncbi:MAG: cation diffusion facilitator family transporter [Candidatus Moranbacteria bacterium]|nr:cation diffusion facilitator family transporter [Candidatus Moranbacteria bacterium]